MKYLIALLTAATGILHLLVGFGLMGGGVTNWLLVLNGIGYLVLLVLFWRAADNPGMIRWILLAYTLITLIGYFAINAANNFGLDNTIALVIKGIELLLVILLFLYRGKQPAPVVRPAPAATTRMGTGMDVPRVDPAVSAAAASSASAGASAAPAVAPAIAAAAAVTAADRSVEEVDYVVDETADMAGDTMEEVDEVVEDTYETAAAAEVVEDTGDAFRGGAVAMAAVAADRMDEPQEADSMAAEAAIAYDMVDKSQEVDTMAAEAALAADVMDKPQDVVAAEAAELDAADLAAEPSTEDLRAELEDYLKSFGPSSEFRKDIEYVEGIGAVYGQKLRAIGISTILDLMVNGATRRGRKHISDQSGIAQSSILTWVNHVDLFRIKGVAQEYADLLEQSGVDTVVELAQRNPVNLHKRMLEINEQKSLVRRAPHASEVQSWVEQAKNLRRLIHY